MENTFVRTDLAAELLSGEDIPRGIESSERTLISGELTVSDIRITNDEGARKIGRPRGRYVTLNFVKPWLCSDATRREIISALSDTLTDMLGTRRQKVLVAGLGNRYMTPDAIGPQALRDIIVTRHVKAQDSAAFDSIGMCEVSAVEPGVTAQTGMETLEVIRGAVENINPSAVIVIDALASRSPDRLVTTIQVTDTGIAPGAGIGNRRSEINFKSLGIPVIAVGVPTVIDSSTIVYSALENAGISDISENLRSVLENGRSFFVSPKDIDAAVTDISDILAQSINKALTL